MLLYPSSIFAQQHPGVPAQAHGNIVGQVRDKDDAIIGATVAVVGTSFIDTTDVNGNFRLASIPTGTHKLSAKAIGYKPHQMDGVIVRTDSTTNVVFVLDQAPVLSSADIHHEERRKALFAFDADTAMGRILLISPFEIAKEESSFAVKHGFIFAKNRWSRIFMDTYNAQAYEVLTAKYGKNFGNLLDSLWNSVHNNR